MTVPRNKRGKRSQLDRAQLRQLWDESNSGQAESSAITALAGEDFDGGLGASSTITTTLDTSGTEPVLSFTVTPRSIGFDEEIQLITQGKLLGAEASTEIEEITVGTGLTLENPSTLNVTLDIGELEDVDLTGLSDNQVLVYDQASLTWKPEAQSAGGGSPGGVAVQMSSILVANFDGQIIVNENAVLVDSLFGAIQVQHDGVFVGGFLSFKI